MRTAAAARQWNGSCHCGAVHFRVTALPSELTTCDCSLCRMRNAVMLRVPEHDLQLLGGEEKLRLYQWNSHRAMHYFCDGCGIYVFHRKRAMPDHFGINVFCLQDFDVNAYPLRATAGASMTLETDQPQPHWPGPRG